MGMMLWYQNEHFLREDKFREREREKRSLEIKVAGQVPLSPLSSQPII